MVQKVSAKKVSAKKVSAKKTFAEKALKGKKVKIPLKHVHCHEAKGEHEHHVHNHAQACRGHIHGRRDCGERECGHYHDHGHGCSGHNHVAGPHHEHTHHDHVHGMLGSMAAGTNEKVVALGFLLTFSYMIVEFVGGYVSGSLALMADAGHMLIDASALALAWGGFYFGRRPRTKQKTFGYLRLEVLAALVNSLFLFGLTVFVGYEAVMRLLNPMPVVPQSMFVVAVIGLLVNMGVFYILNRGEKDHLNIKAAALHVMGDMLGSVAAIVAAVIIYFTGFVQADSILSLFVGALILKNVIKLFQSTYDILMEGVPAHIDVDEIEQRIGQVPDVDFVCHVHVWALTSGKVIATLNISVKDERKILPTVRAVKQVLAQEFGILHATVGIDASDCSLEGGAHE